MKYLAIFLLTLLFTRPRKGKDVVIFLLVFLFTISLLYLTEDIDAWWFGWIVLPIIYAVIFLAISFIVNYCYYHLLAQSFIKLRDSLHTINFSNINKYIRNQAIEDFLLTNCKDTNGQYLAPMQTLAKKFSEAPATQHPLFYSAAAYYYLYIEHDKLRASQCCASFFSLSCLSKREYATSNLYHWMATEPAFNHLFSRYGDFLYSGISYSLDNIITLP